VETFSDRLIGRCGLLPWKIDGTDEVELAYLIEKTRWREGFATEAARAIVEYARVKLGLSRLISLTTPGNAASVRIAEKVAMTFERQMEDEFGPCWIYGLSQEPTH
jgi:RimJ/RimL family protein N-acetyltransferase